MSEYQFQHTKGPWLLDTRQYPETTEICNRDHFIISEDYSTTMCKMPDVEYDQHEQERFANAVIMRASPELVERLEKLIKYATYLEKEIDRLNKLDHCGEGGSVEKARALLSRIEKEQNTL